MTFKLFDVDFSAYLLLLTAISLLLTIYTSFNNYVECFSSDVSLAKRLCRFFIRKSRTNFIDVQVSTIYQLHHFY